jgi:TatA/E family protein of Tat protein translocase
MTPLFIFPEFGTTELLFILVVALVLFGPRKLPQLSRSLGRSLAEFKRASEEFKKTWEREVELESAQREMPTNERAVLPEDNSMMTASAEQQQHLDATDSAQLSATVSTVPTVEELARRAAVTERDEARVARRAYSSASSTTGQEDLSTDEAPATTLHNEAASAEDEIKNSSSGIDAANTNASLSSPPSSRKRDWL